MIKRFLILSLLLASCGTQQGGDSGVSSSAPEEAIQSPVLTPTSVEGTVSKGIVKNAIVEVKKMNLDGSAGEILGTGKTDENGNFRIALIKPPDGPVAFEIKGGEYTDEASGQLITLSKEKTDLSLATEIAAGQKSTGIAVTSLTTIAMQQVKTEMKKTENADLKTIIASANTKVAAQFGLANIDKTIPADLTDNRLDDPLKLETKYGAILSSISQAAQDLGKSSSLDFTKDLAEGQSLPKTFMTEEFPQAIKNFLNSEFNKSGIKAVDLSDFIKQFEAPKPIAEGSLVIDSTPQGAKVFMGDTEKGITPLSLSLTPGSYVVTLKKEGFSDFSFSTVDVVSEQVARLSQVLTALEGTLVINSNPEGAQVFIEGKDKGQTPLTVSISPGSYMMDLKKEGFQDLSQNIEISAGLSQNVTLTLVAVEVPPPPVPKQGTIVVHSNPQGAEVFINKVSKGITSSTNPLTIVLEKGTYDVEFRKTEFNDVTQSITVEGGQTTQVSKILTPLEGKLIVSSTPSGADVLIDGSSKGVTPLNISMKKGSYDLILKLSRFNDHSQKITVVEGQELNITQTLEEETGKLIAFSMPINADVFVDNTLKGKTPVTLNLKEGRYDVTFKKAGYEDKIQNVSIAIGKETRVAPLLNCIPNQYIYTENIFIFQRKPSDLIKVNAGLGVRERGLPGNYDSFDENGIFLTYKCPVVKGIVHIPVLLADFPDYDPATDPANENVAVRDPNNFLGKPIPTYVQSTRDQIDAYLNGPLGIGQYYKDVTGGQVEMHFDVFDWVAIKPRIEYTGKEAPPNRRCLFRQRMFFDAVKANYINNPQFKINLQSGKYDSDRNLVMDGAVLLYEGQMTDCPPVEMQFGGQIPQPPDFIFTPKVFRQEIPEIPDIPGSVQFWTNIPEIQYDPSSTRIDLRQRGTWVHEMGHVMLGYLDYYFRHFNMGHWGLSANHGEFPAHPAAYEKWIFFKIIEPKEINQSIGSVQEYEIIANEIPDGTTYDQGIYLYKIPIDNDPNARFLTIGNRLFNDELDGPPANVFSSRTGSLWAPAYFGRESGLMIVEANLRARATDARIRPSQFFKHDAPIHNPRFLVPDFSAFRPGDTFRKCYKDKCVKIFDITEPGRTVKFKVAIEPPQ